MALLPRGHNSLLNMRDHDTGPITDAWQALLEANEHLADSIESAQSECQALLVDSERGDCEVIERPTIAQLRSIARALPHLNHRGSEIVGLLLCPSPAVSAAVEAVNQCKVALRDCVDDLKASTTPDHRDANNIPSDLSSVIIGEWVSKSTRSKPVERALQHTPLDKYHLGKVYRPIRLFKQPVVRTYWQWIAGQHRIRSIDPAGLRQLIALRRKNRTISEMTAGQWLDALEGVPPHAIRRVQFMAPVFRLQISLRVDGNRRLARSTLSGNGVVIAQQLNLPDKFGVGKKPDTELSSNPVEERRKSWEALSANRKRQYEALIPELGVYAIRDKS